MMSGYVFVDWRGVENALGHGISAAKLAKHAGVDPRTVSRAIRGVRMQRASAVDVVRATKVANPELYISSIEGVQSSEHSSGLENYGSWEVEDEAREYRLIRDIPFWIGKATHSLDGRVGRLKRFTLGKQLNDEDFEIAKLELSRHPTICGRLERHPNFPLYYDSKFNGQSCFWLVEKWEADQTLKQFVESESFCVSCVPKLAIQLAVALNDLHKAGIVRRELNPSTILIRENDRSPLLVDFETATFAFNTSSRKIEWKRDPFLAREVDSPDVDLRADLYGWAQIVIYCLTQKWPKPNYDRIFFTALPVPKEVATVLEAFTQDNRDWRKVEPKSQPPVVDFESLLGFIKGWEKEPSE